MNFVEQRLCDLIHEKATEGRLAIKIDELASDLKEGRGPTYSALKALEKKKKIVTQGRGKKGIEIHLLEQQKKSNSLNGSKPINNTTIENKEIIATKITLKEISDILTNASLGELEIIKDLVELNILKRKNNE